MAKIHEALKQAMDHYGVQGKQLAELSGISPHHLSEFRSGKKWVSEEVLEALIENMDHLSPGAKAYFCQLLAGEDCERTKRTKRDRKQLLINLIQNAEVDEIEAALLAIGKKWSEQIKPKGNEKKYLNEYAEVM